MRNVIFASVVTLACGPAIGEPALSDCDWRASAEYITEPWGENSLTFGNGATRIALIDTVEPAAGSVGLLILSPPLGETYERQCKLLDGFSALSLEGLETSYDPAFGLQLELTAQVFLEGESEFASAKVDILINQSTGDIEFSVMPYFN